MHYVANVTEVGQVGTIGQIVPTDDTHEHLDDSRLVLDFFLTTEGQWKVSRFYNPRTNDRGMPPSCFVPDELIVKALNVARHNAREDRFGIGHHNFEIEAV